MYALGVFGWLHRLRNRRNLAVVSFHRVMSSDDPRWASRDPDYTFEVGLFRKVLGFFKQHYNVVSLQQLLDASDGSQRLPARPLLITFDDGWLDNLDHALPALREAGLPAVMFVVADAIGRDAPFWQERVMSAWQRGQLDQRQLRQAMGDTSGASHAGDIGELRGIITLLETLDDERRERILAPFAEAMDDGLRHMVGAEDLVALQRGGVAIGVHGKRHVPLPGAKDIEGELSGAWNAVNAAVTGAGGDPISPGMSFPHGLHDAEVSALASKAGYRLQFTSTPVATPVAGRFGPLVGRSGFEMVTARDAQGEFRPDQLAWYLFRRQPLHLG